MSKGIVELNYIMLMSNLGLPLIDVHVMVRIEFSPLGIILR